MKAFYIVLIVAFAIVFSGCNGKDTQQEVVVQETVQPTTVPEPVPVPVPEPEVKTTVIKQDQKYIDADNPDVKPIVQHRYEENYEKAVSAKEPDVNEKPAPEEKTYIKVIAKNFDNPEELRQIRYTIVQSCQGKNYSLPREEREDRKGFSFEIWSKMGPITLTETISNALLDDGYDVHIQRKKDNLIVITPGGS